MSNTIIRQDDFPYDIMHKGHGDIHKHNKRVNDALRKQIKDVVNQHDIITSEGNKKVKVHLKGLHQYRFTHSKDHIDRIARDEFDDLEENEIIYKPNKNEDGGKAGESPGEELYEAEYTIEELTDILMEELKLPFWDDNKKNELIVENFEWDDVCKKSGGQYLIDKKRTILSSILRKAKSKAFSSKTPKSIVNDDFRFRTYTVNLEKRSNAVVFLMMDRSGSMMEDMIYSAKALFFWVVQFLKRRYDKIDIRFISHDYNAKEMNEKDFFSVSESGGTRISAAYTLCQDIIKKQYPSNLWNIYCFHASDGDSYGDEELCVKLIDNILNLGANLFGYAEISFFGNQQRKSDFFNRIYKIKNPSVRVATINSHADILHTIKNFFNYRVKNNAK